MLVVTSRERSRTSLPNYGKSFKQLHQRIGRRIEKSDLADRD
jgi:hypothetical protein